MTLFFSYPRAGLFFPFFFGCVLDEFVRLMVATCNLAFCVIARGVFLGSSKSNQFQGISTQENALSCGLIFSCINFSSNAPKQTHTIFQAARKVTYNFRGIKSIHSLSKTLQLVLKSKTQPKQKKKTPRWKSKRKTYQRIQDFGALALAH